MRMPSDGLFENEYHAGANQIRKDHKNILNRLRSIKEDADFVKEIASLFPSLPLVANERCGSWYIDPTEKQVHSAYFKSTDGHMSQWDLNLRRSNLHLLDIINEYKGCIIVDSTRRGKRIPDALSKTIPIWCCAINRAVIQYKPGLFDNEEARAFYSLPSAVSRSEHAQIEARMDEFAQRLLNSGGIDMKRISRLLQKPLRPLWFTPQSSFFEAPDYTEAPFWPVICLSASQAVESGCQARPGYLYVQGSGDDQEAWCHGLTPRLFWQNRKALLNATSAADCEEQVHKIVAMKEEDADENDFSMIQGTTMAIGSTKAWHTFDIVINCTESNPPADHSRCLQLPIPEGKKGQYKLLQSIPEAIAFVREPLMQNKRILVYGTKGRDRAVGIALAIYVKYYDHQGKFCPDSTGKVDKKNIHEHLLKIISSRPKAAPSRVTLKKVNTYFMS